MKKAKKGFTIVELVVVIAVIAILAAVLIPTFISIVNRAKVSNDNQLVRNLNTALITEEADGNKAENMSQAIEIAEDYGYKLENLQAKADGYVLLWNQTTNRFYVESAEGTITSNPEVTDFPAENYTYWEISKTLGTKHSTYLTEGSGNIAATNLGVDVSGISSAVNVTYTGNSNKVIIATNGGDLSVNAENGHVAHYGFVKNLTVTAVNGADCYREHGYVGTLATFGTGKFVAEKGSQFHQTEEQIKTAVNPESNTFVDLGATYGVHKRDENGICVICNDGGTPSAKNGLVDGYYYKDDVLYTGTEGGYEFKDGMLLLREQLNDDTITVNTYNGERTSTQNFDINNIPKQYKTEKIVLKMSDISVLNYEINADGYNISSAIVEAPLLDLLTKNSWTDTDIAKLVNAEARSHFLSVYDAGTYYYSYPSDKNNEAKMYLPYVNMTNDLEAYLSLLNYDLSTSTDLVKKYIEDFSDDKLPLTFSEYLKLKYIKNKIISEIVNNDNVYSFKCAGVESYIYDINNRTSSTNISSGTGYKNDPAFNLEVSATGGFILGQCGYMNGDYTDNINIINSDGRWVFSSTDLASSANVWWDGNTADGSGKSYTTQQHIELHSVIKDSTTQEYAYVGRKLVIEITDNNTLKAWFVKKDYANSEEVIENVGEYSLSPKTGETILSQEEVNAVSLLSFNDYQFDSLEIINGCFNVGENNKHTTYVHCENEVIELYYKMLVKCSGVTIGEEILYYSETGLIDITNLVSMSDIVKSYFPSSQGSDLIYPSMEIILEINN